MNLRIFVSLCKPCFKWAFLFLVFIIISFSLNGQNTVGLISYDVAHSYQGYTLIYPHNQANVYLLDNCGEVVHSWIDEGDYRPGNTVYLRPDGSIVKAKRPTSIANDNIWAGGGGAIIEILSWENEMLWSFEMNNDSMRLHHDIALLPNGNILALAWELKSNAEAIANGRRPDLLNQEVLWPDMVFEINPETDEIVWEWHAWDHLVQDYDGSKENFGVVSDHKELININYDTNDGKSDWMHSNALDYNAELDQIMISVPTFSELMIIDHSTTTEEAASHFGGFSNRGGDILYRFGNLAAYEQGDSTDQLLFYQHDAHWSNEFLPQMHPYANHIVVFNNRLQNYSAVEIFESTWNMYLSDYDAFNGSFPPYQLENTVTHPDQNSFYSTGLSSAQLLPNGNILACSGRQGYMVELTSENEIVWEYITPMEGGFPVEQGTMLELNDNLTFRAFRYPIDYSAFENRDLSSKGFIELLPFEEFCDNLLSTSLPIKFNIEIFPNPANQRLHLSWDTGELIEIRIFDILGRLRISDNGNGGMKYLDISELEPNIYFLELENIGVLKFVVE